MATRRPRGSGHLFRPKTKGVEQAVWWLAYHVRGALVRESTGTTVKTHAEKILREKIRAVDTGETTDAAALRTTLGDVAKLVTDDYTNNDRRTVREVRRAFDRLAEFFGGGASEHARERGRGLLAARIGAAEVEKYKVAGRKRGAANATINRELGQLRRGLRLAVNMGSWRVIEGRGIIEAQNY